MYICRQYAAIAGNPGADPLSTYTSIARQYTKDVVGGKVPTCKWVRAACQRQLDDLDRFKGKDSLSEMPRCHRH
jgi:hypothetical protein